MLDFDGKPISYQYPLPCSPPTGPLTVLSQAVCQRNPSQRKLSLSFDQKLLISNEACILSPKKFRYLKCTWNIFFFGGWIFPYISRIHAFFVGEDSSILVNYLKCLMILNDFGSFRCTTHYVLRVWHVWPYDVNGKNHGTIGESNCDPTVWRPLLLFNHPKRSLKGRIARSLEILFINRFLKKPRVFAPPVFVAYKQHCRLQVKNLIAVILLHLLPQLLDFSRRRLRVARARWETLAKFKTLVLLNPASSDLGRTLVASVRCWKAMKITWFFDHWHLCCKGYRYPCQKGKCPVALCKVLCWSWHPGSIVVKRDQSVPIHATSEDPLCLELLFFLPVTIPDSFSGIP